MNHLILPRAVVGEGDASVLLEVRGHSVRIKRRGMPEVLLPLDSARDVGRFLIDLAA